MNEYTGLGVMSGTSLDGIDIALCIFSEENTKWNYKIEEAKTYPYNDFWINKFAHAHSLNSLDLMKLHKEYGFYIGRFINEFLENAEIKVNYMASHGHTIFHQPEVGITFQLGDGAAIASETNLTTISDFRNQDVILGGNGAPLVPIGDKLLFPEYAYCLNLGGFSNISYEKENKRIAFDICPTNTIINNLSKKLNHEYDKDGKLAAKGKVNNALLHELNILGYYQQNPPKSLSREWLWSLFIPIVEFAKISTEDKLRTVYEHISYQIAQSFDNIENHEVLITGGGAHNKFLVELIKKKTNNTLVIPSSQLIEFKEALIFAFLGLLKIQNKVNCLSSVTGARKDHSSGIIYNF